MNEIEKTINLHIITKKVLLENMKMNRNTIKEYKFNKESSKVLIKRLKKENECMKYVIRKVLNRAIETYICIKNSID
jgi:hypothetical protein